MRINRLPATTYRHLKMNDVDLQWPLQNAPLHSEGAFVSCEALPLEIPTGAGTEADSIFEKAIVQKCALLPGTSEDVRIRICAESDSACGTYLLDVQEGSSLTLIMSYENAPENTHLAVRTLLHLAKDAKVKLVQLQMCKEGHQLLNDIGCTCEEGASFELLQVYPGEGDVYNGVRVELVGADSKFSSDVAYLGCGKQKLDMNYIVNHIGERTISRLEADGVLKDEAHKLFRGTIDFKTGASGAKGNENEKVLVLGEGCINQTIPLILCSEEDVEGNHGAAIGGLDEEMLFYLASRGLDETASQKVMTRAYLNRVIQMIGDAQVTEQMEAYVERLLG